MKEQPELRICLRKRPSGKVELSVYDVLAEKESRTDWQVFAHELDAKIRELKLTLERNGNRVTVKELPCY